MTIKEYVEKVLEDVDSAELTGGTVHIDIAVLPDPSGKLYVPTQKDVHAGASRVSFDIKLDKKDVPSV